MLDKYLITVKKNGTFFAGYHQSYAKSAEKTYLSEHLRVIRVVSGKGYWKIENNIYEVHKGDVLVFNNVTPRQIVEVTSAPLVYELIGFSIDVFSLDTYYIRLFYTQVPKHPVLSVDLAETKQIHTLFELLKQRFQNNSSETAVVSCLINAICFIINEYFGSKFAEKESTRLPYQTTCEVMEKAIRYIEQHLCELHNVAEIADNMHISRGYFHKIFTKYTGYTPKYFINHCRIVRFVSLLTTEDITVLDAAMKCGFESASGFYKTFYTICGTSPREYLSQHFLK